MAELVTIAAAEADALAKTLSGVATVAAVELETKAAVIAGDLEHKAASIAATAAEELKTTAAAIAAQLEQTARTAAGQRRVNLIWESTQAAIALVVTGSTIYSALKGIDAAILGNAFVMIIAIYFVRTNHTKIGGVGGSESR